jgi:ubiquinone/menaquinone biosynthesis C-methylase UbiE
MSLLGYDVIGVDLSQEMLSAALDKKIKSGLNIQYLCQDMTRLDMFGTIDITICALDSLNHLKNSEEIEKTFERVSLFSNPGGIFIFDMNTVFKHENVLSDNVFIYDTPEVYCIWENYFSKKDNRIDIDMTFFEKSGGCFYRYDESFFETAYPIEELKRLLKKTGFDLIGEYDYMNFDKPHEKSEKITFLARKAL